MTSNQVAYGANLINQQAVDETARHNVAVEEETGRHNKVTEALATRQADLEQEKLGIEERYKQESLRIQEEYNREYLAWQRTQGQAKLDIEQQLADTKDYEAQMRAKYEQDMALIASNEADIKQQLADETERNNKAIEGLRSREVAAKEWSNFLTNKSIEYQNSYWNASIALGNLNAVYGEAASLRNHELGLLNIEQKYTEAMANTSLKKMELEMRRPLVYTETFKNIGSGIGNLFGSIVGSGSRLLMGF